MEGIWQDVRQGIRSLARERGFTAVAALTLALGIGANTTIFSVVNAVLLRPLPYPEAGRLVTVEGNFLRLGMERIGACMPEFLDYRDRSRAFEQVAAFRAQGFTLTGDGEPERIPGARVSSSLFPLLKVGARQGRLFSAGEDRLGADAVVVLGHGLWQRRFGSDPAILGSTLVLDGRPRTVIGVMPPGFAFPHPGFAFADRADLWIPLAPTPEQLRERGRYDLRVLARLRPGVTLEEARAEMALLGADFERRNPGHYRGPGGEDGGWRVTVIPLKERVVAGIRPSLLVLLAAVAFVLLIACANVAGLLLCRAVARRRAMAIRLALGSGRFRIVRQLLTESLLLALAGGALGLLLALWGIDLLKGMNPADFPRVGEIGLDARVLGFTLAASILAAAAFGVVPALRATRIDIHEALRDGSLGATGGPGAARGRSLLVAGQYALALVLTIGAALTLQSLWRLQRTSPGFKPENILTLDVALPETRYPEASRRAAFFEQLLQEVERLPGVRAAGAVSLLPLQGAGFGGPFSVEGRPLDPDRPAFASYRSTSSGYFDALGIPLHRGRPFTEDDRAGSPAVVIVNETLARAFFKGQDPLGKRIKLGAPGSPRPWLTIVGVAGDVSESGPGAAPAPGMYVPHGQDPASALSLAIATSSAPLAVAAGVRSAVHRLDREEPITNVRTLEQAVSDSISRPRFLAVLLGLFAGMALFLAAVGVYAVMATSVEQRTREIGIRAAMGAQRHHILGLVVGQGVKLALAGIGVGLLVSLALTRFLSNLLFGVAPWDPLTFVTVALLLAGVALLAAALPARRATKVDPMTALRCE